MTTFYDREGTPRTCEEALDILVYLKHHKPKDSRVWKPQDHVGSAPEPIRSDIELSLKVRAVLYALGIDLDDQRVSDTVAYVDRCSVEDTTTRPRTIGWEEEAHL